MGLNKKTGSLRERAEKEIQNAKVKGNIPESTAELVHELQVHQTELEMQNEELRETQEELTKLYDEYHEMYNEAPVGYFSLDNKGNVRNVNIKGAELLGLEKDRIIGFGFILFIPSNYQTKYHNSLKDAMVNHEIQEVELQLKRKKSLFYVQMQIMPIYDKVDEKYRITITDITERKKAEEALHESYERFNLAQKVSNVGTFEWNIQTGVNTWTPELEALYGLQEGEFPGTQEAWEELLHPEDKQEAIHGVDVALETGKPNEAEFRVIWPDGSIHWLLGRWQVIKDDEGKPLKLIGVNVDITERKQAEEENYRLMVDLDKQHNLLDTIIEQLPVGVGIADAPSGQLIRINEQTRRIWMMDHMEADDMAGYGKYAGFHPDGRQYSSEDWQLVRAVKGEVIHGEELEFIRGDGKHRFMRSNATPVKDADGNVKAAVVVIDDITERKKLEEELRKSRNNLELKVQERTAELDILIDELKRSNAELQQFAYVSSHDLQEPLRTIASFTQLLERRYKGKLDSDADEFMDYIVEAAKRMQQLINDLLEYSRVTTQAKEFETVDVNEVLNTVLSNLKISIDEDNVEIIYDNLPIIMADSSQLVQLFQNLIGNAIKFRKPDEPPIINVSAHKDEENNEYIFSVQDNGIGMEPQYAERIFVIFQRLHTKEVYSGTGIGLSIAKKIVERHGGRVWVESDFGGGSTFYFTIPVELVEN